MSDIKSYTDLKQSKILAGILPLESADMHYVLIDTDENKYSAGLGKYIGILPHYPCWSLAALLNNIPQVKLDNIKQYDKKYWRCCAYFASDWHNSDWCNNPVDACYEMILKLHELKML